MSEAIVVNMNYDEHLSKKTFIISTNDQAMMKFFDRVLLIDKGEIVHFDSFEVVKETAEYKEALGALDKVAEVEEEEGNRATIVSKRV